MNHDLQRFYLPALREASGGAVLDFGSGHGRLISFLRAEGFHDVSGFERNEALRGELTAEVLERTTFGADGGAFLRQAGRRWKAVVLKDVLYYFDDAGAEAFLRELGTHLEDGALLAVEVFNGATLTGPYVMFKDRGIRRVFTEQSLASLLRDSGYTVESIQGMAPAVTGAGSAVFWLFSRLWKLKLRLLYWLERGWDAQNPAILEKKIFAVARQRGGSRG